MFRAFRGSSFSSFPLCDFAALREPFRPVGVPRLTIQQPVGIPTNVTGLDASCRPQIMGVAVPAPPSGFVWLVYFVVALVHESLVIRARRSRGIVLPLLQQEGSYRE